jgi:hypothetical protein
VDVHPVHDRQIKRSAALDHSSAHAAHIVRMRLSHIPNVRHCPEVFGICADLPPKSSHNGPPIALKKAISAD